MIGKSRLNITVSIKEILVIGLFASCHSVIQKPIFLDGNRIEGNNTSDTILNGHIKFYDTFTNKLLAEGDYINGIRNGEYRQYRENGTLTIDLLYKDGKENGKAKIFDARGEIIAEDSYYYGLRSGNLIKYQNGKIKAYAFNSLENKNLIYFEYDSFKGKHLPDVLKDYFFYSSTEYHYENDTLPNRLEYFLYTPNPPKYEFKYGLVKVDKSLKILSTIMEFDKNKSWTKFDYDSKWDASNALVAIKLEITDSTNKDEITMLKVLRK